MIKNDLRHNRIWLNGIKRRFRRKPTAETATNLAHAFAMGWACTGDLEDPNDQIERICAAETIAVFTAMAVKYPLMARCVMAALEADQGQIISGTYYFKDINGMPRIDKAGFKTEIVNDARRILLGNTVRMEYLRYTLNCVPTDPNERLDRWKMEHELERLQKEMA